MSEGKIDLKTVGAVIGVVGALAAAAGSGGWTAAVVPGNLTGFMSNF